MSELRKKVLGLRVGGCGESSRTPDEGQKSRPILFCAADGPDRFVPPTKENNVKALFQRASLLKIHADGERVSRADDLSEAVESESQL